MEVKATWSVPIHGDLSQVYKNINMNLELKPLNLKIKRLTETAVLPTQGSAQAAGFDLYADIPISNKNLEQSQSLLIEPHQTLFIGTGLSMAIPEGFFGAIYARSGLACKQFLRPANCVGVVDSDYRGQIVVALHNDSEEPKLITHGQRIAQLILQPCFNTIITEVDELNSTDRGEGGFGSSGV